MSVRFFDHPDYFELRINNTGKSNCIDSHTWEAISHGDFTADKRILITAEKCPMRKSSGNIVCSGFDLGQLGKYRDDPLTVSNMLGSVPHAFDTLRRHPAAIKCFVNGLVLCGGVGFALVSDYVVATDKTIFKLPDDAGMRAAAKFLLPLALRNMKDWDGAPISAQVAKGKYGLVHKIVDSQHTNEQFLAEASLPREIVRNSLKLSLAYPRGTAAAAQIPQAILDGVLSFLAVSHAEHLQRAQKSKEAHESHRAEWLEHH